MIEFSYTYIITKLTLTHSTPAAPGHPRREAGLHWPPGGDRRPCSGHHWPASAHRLTASQMLSSTEGSNNKLSRVTCQVSPALHI